MFLSFLHKIEFVCQIKNGPCWWIGCEWSHLSTFHKSIGFSQNKWYLKPGWGSDLVPETVYEVKNLAAFEACLHLHFDLTALGRCSEIFCRHFHCFLFIFLTTDIWFTVIGPLDELFILKFKALVLHKNFSQPWHKPIRPNKPFAIFVEAW